MISNITGWLKRLAGAICLTYAVLLGLLALTGSLQAYYYELDEWLNPAFYNTAGRGSNHHPADLINSLESQVPGARVWYMEQPKGIGRSVMMAVEPVFDEATQQYAAIPHTYYYMDPATGDIVGARTWGACCFEAENLMNFTYELHRNLLLPGVWGLYITGGIALVWFAACIISLFYGALSFPARRLTKNSLALLVAVPVLMLPLAISSVALNLNDELFRPFINFLSPIKPTIYGEYAARNTQDFGERRLSYRDAYDRGLEIQQEKGWDKTVGEFFYSDIYNFYGLGYGLRDPKNMGNDWIFLDANDGKILRERFPTQGTRGEIFAAAQLPVHSGRVLGFWSQIYVFVMGLLITWLCWRLGRWGWRMVKGGR